MTMPNPFLSAIPSTLLLAKAASSIATTGAKRPAIPVMGASASNDPAERIIERRVRAIIKVMNRYTAWRPLWEEVVCRAEDLTFVCEECNSLEPVLRGRISHPPW